MRLVALAAALLCALPAPAAARDATNGAPLLLSKPALCVAYASAEVRPASLVFGLGGDPFR